FSFHGFLVIIFLIKTNLVSLSWKSSKWALASLLPLIKFAFQFSFFSFIYFKKLNLAFSSKPLLGRFLPFADKYIIASK
ncbi:hypothetical protein ACJOMQ_03890, partial [Mycoplasmopsis synoviae]|uniref:hypothetical protein n=1 Tax=Mycoplasmopsis synoviae TaxID=2109 RepID=UPI00387B56EB